MKRVTQDQLEAKATELGRNIEFDNEQNIGVLKVGSTEWYAALTDPAVTS